jgi:hypothetical protein
MTCVIVTTGHVEAKVEALLTSIDKDIPIKFRPSEVSKEIQFLKSGKACGFYGIPNIYLQHLPRPLVHLTYLFNHCLRLGHSPATLKEVKVIILPR